MEKDLAKKRKRKLSVKESYDFLLNEESDKLIDNDNLIKRAINNVEQDGIVFIDEIDKICGKSGRGSAEVSRRCSKRSFAFDRKGLQLVQSTAQLKQIIFFL